MSRLLIELYISRNEIDDYYTIYIYIILKFQTNSNRYATHVIIAAQVVKLSLIGLKIRRIRSFILLLFSYITLPVHLYGKMCAHLCTSTDSDHKCQQI